MPDIRFMPTPADTVRSRRLVVSGSGLGGLACRLRLAWERWRLVAAALGCLVSQRVCIGEVPAAPVPLEREAPWRIASFAHDAGVARRAVFDVAFETNNVAWFAASDGLYRYDGYGWRRFTASNGLPSSFVRTVAVPRDGTVWIGTDRGAVAFDGQRFDRRGTENKLAGPNVRRIVETSDGSLWFCCDQWPDATSSGGLTRLWKGEFRTYRMTNGLPSEHLINLFESADGGIRAMTSTGTAAWRGGRWEPLREEGTTEDGLKWNMVQDREGTIFAQGHKAIWAGRDGRWRDCPGMPSVGASPICLTREGSIVKCVLSDEGTLVFARWDGQAFVRASATVAGPGSTLESVRQAPDGSIWAVGRGTILRWEYLPGAWEWRPDLPPPALEDRQRRLWFMAPTGSVVQAGEGTRLVPEMRSIAAEDGQGRVWSAGVTGAVCWTEGRIEVFPPETCGIASLEGIQIDRDGIPWLRGRGSSGGEVVSGLLPRGWRVYGENVIRGRVIESVEPDPRGGIVISVSDVVSHVSELARLTGDGFRSFPMRLPSPHPYRPALWTSSTRFFLTAYNGLWESPLEEPLSFVRSQPDASGISGCPGRSGDTAVFLARETAGGNAAILVRRRNEWLRHRLAYGEAAWRSPDGWLMVADGDEVVLWKLDEWDRPVYLGLPTETTIISMLRSSDGDYWLGTRQGVLHLRPSRALPSTALSGSKSARQGAKLQVRATAIAPFVPQGHSRRFSFEWRTDAGVWSGYGDWPESGIPTDTLAPGPHVLQVRSRDGLGNEAAFPAAFAFDVLPVPLQERSWFGPALAGLGAVLAGLSLALYSVVRRLRRYSGHLEDQVRARTAELLQDIQRRERLEEELQHSEKRFRALVEQGADAICLVATDGTVLYEGPTVERLTGYGPTERLGQPWVRTIHLDDLPGVRGVLDRVLAQPGHIETLQFRSLRKDGSVWWAEGTATNLTHEAGVQAIVINYRDISQRKMVEVEKEKVQEQLVQAQKMESVGRLAGGVAHDFNNMLQAILGNVGLALAQENLSPELVENLEEIQKAGQRSADLTRQLLAFARKQTVSPQILDLNDTVAGMLKMLRRLIGEDIQLAWLPGAGLGPVRLDPSQLDQVLANLTVNARDAIGGVGKITIQTEGRTIAESESRRHGECEPGDYVVLSVSDTGHGMDAETQSHLFEPFFTTKGVGEGTGLGLATVYGIVTQNGGFVEVESAVGRGTTFRIHLPRAETSGVSHPGSGEVEEQARRGVETVLLVEDEPAVLRLGRRIMEGLGYRVLTAATPAEALRVAGERKERIDLLITDVIMPEMNGRELAERVRALHPGVKCLFMSGYAASVIAQHGILEEGTTFVQKPFSVNELSAKVRVALEHVGS